MTSLLTPGNITFCIGILGIIFTIYHYFKNPQIKAEKTEALISQQLKYIQESNDRRFCDMQREIKEVLTTSQNHIHTVDTKVEALAAIVGQIGKDLVRLGTIIEERIPKKCE